MNNYKPSPLVNPADLTTEDLARYITAELQAISESIAVLNTQRYNVTYVVPPRPREAMQAYADGTKWNPGAGKGFYFYTGAVWVPMF